MATRDDLRAELALFRDDVKDAVLAALRERGTVENKILPQYPMSVVSALSYIHEDGNKLREEHKEETA